MKIYTDRNWVIVKDKKKTPNVRANNVYYMLLQCKYYFLAQ